MPNYIAHNAKQLLTRKTKNICSWKSRFSVGVKDAASSNVMTQNNNIKVLTPNQRSWDKTIKRTSQPIKGRDTNTTRGVSHCGLAIYIKKYLKAKEELWKFKYFTIQKYNLWKNPLNNPKSSTYHSSITNLKFQHKPKYHLPKILI
jgi:hypothetical protein